MNVSTTTDTPRERRAATLVMACVGVFVAYLPVTTVSVSLPAIQRALHASTAELSWVSDAFVLPMAALILTAGVFGDVHGRKKVFLAGLLFSAVGAAIALSAGSIEVLWAGQAVSGLGAAALLPTTLALISHAVPDPRERGKFVGLWATSLMGALALGPVIAGLILEHFAWRWIYLLPIPASLLALVMVARLVSDSRAPGTRRLDWPGQISAAVTITALVYGVIEGGAGSFTEAEVVVALVLAAIGAVVFVVAERRSESPMLDLKLFRSPAFTATTLVAMISFLGLIGFFFALSLYFGMVQQLTTLESAGRMILVTLAAIVVSQPASRLMHRWSPRVLITGGLLVTSGALLSLTSVGVDTSYGSLSWRLILLGVGLGFVITPMTATAVASVPHQLAGMAAAGNNAFRQVGGALGPAVLGAVLSTKAANALPGHLADAGISAAATRRIGEAVNEGGLGAVARLDLGPEQGRALGAMSEAFLDGLHLCLVIAAGLAAVAALVAAVLLRRPQGVPGPTRIAGSETGSAAESEARSAAGSEAGAEAGSATRAAGSTAGAEAGSVAGAKAGVPAQPPVQTSTTT
ncbi:MFS transporter [Streptomyces acidiscabies]|uniref:MFS transporter n=1 Tax=Streptomyces acidiscabies TaxID=42234 RepID=UPI0009534765|nr:multidrug resistance protein stp [Streptomyces acidiscabies]